MHIHNDLFFYFPLKQDHAIGRPNTHMHRSYFIPRANPSRTISFCTVGITSPCSPSFAYRSTFFLSSTFLLLTLQYTITVHTMYGWRGSSFYDSNSMYLGEIAFCIGRTDGSPIPPPFCMSYTPVPSFFLLDAYVGVRHDASASPFCSKRCRYRDIALQRSTSTCKAEMKNAYVDARYFERRASFIFKESCVETVFWVSFKN